MNTVLIGASAMALLLFGTATVAFRAGADHMRSEFLGEQVTQAENVLTRVVERERAVEKVVTKYVVNTRTIEVASLEVKDEIPKIVDADCVLPPDFMRGLRAASRNTTAEAAGIAEDSAERADCRATLEIVRRSYENHYLDAEQLKALIAWALGVETAHGGT